MISEISPFNDFVCIKVCHNRRVWCFGIVLVCPCLYTNRTSKELQTLLSLFFFSKFELPNRGCGLSTGAAYTWNFTVCFSCCWLQCFDASSTRLQETLVSMNNTMDMCILINLLSPSIKLQFLLLCFHTFLTEVVGRSC